MVLLFQQVEQGEGVEECHRSLWTIVILTHKITLTINFMGLKVEWFEAGNYNFTESDRYCNSCNS